MKVTRFYTGEDGRSHFEDLEIPLNQVRGRMMSDAIAVTGMSFRESAGNLVLDLHVAPRRQLILCLTGEVEIELGNGELRRFVPGDVYLADDLTGEGHIHREVKGPVRHAWVFLDPQLDLSPWRQA
jgi:hypothetical protein